MNGEKPRQVKARRGVSVVYRGKTLLSLIDPISQAERVVKALPLFKQTLYLCCSPLLGYGLHELLDRITSDSAVFCIEADSALMEFSAKELPPDVVEHPRLRFASVKDGQSACFILRREFGPRRFRRVVPVMLNGAYALSSDTYDEIETTVREDIALEWANAMTLVKLGRRYALNAIRNLALLPSSRPLNASMFKDAPLLVLGAGPSLETISFLLEPDRHFYVVCVDTALIPLLERGIIPDLVVALEAQHWNLRDFIGSANRYCPLALDLSSLPRSAHISDGPRYLFSVSWTSLRLLDRLKKAGLRPPEIPPLGSVGLAAVAAALQAGTGPIVLAGLDFAYDIGSYHTRSAPSRLERLSQTTRLKSLIDPAPAFRSGVVPAVGKSNIRIRTDPALRGYRNQFEREFGKIDRLFDAGDRGLELGIKNISIPEAARILSGTSPLLKKAENGPFPGIADAASTISFINAELDRIETLFAVLTEGKRTADFESLVDDCDFLWAHFPECAGADGARPPVSDISFMKRIRAEIDPFRKAFRIARAELERS